MDGASKLVNIPYRFMFISLIPIFLFSIVIPEVPNSEFYISLDQFLDSFALGMVGFTSELFPFTAKVISNYVVVAIPFLSVYVMVIVGKEAVIKSKSGIKNTFSTLYLCMTTIGFILLTALIIYMSYFSVTDLSQHNRMYRIFGSQPFFFAIFSAIWMLALYLIIVMNFIYFIVIPYIILVKKPFVPK
ncbi:hypothetical protein FHU10_2185 [Serratia fonticola]|uniref:Uncharacterized protein n=1 Tax=Serratia fonticola TaxID=47917 RepID=A0A559T4W6_SERFO|nr:hypothetical protein [Serratia fonticola]TQI77844.1 hypothetical protein FHU09_0266 [Serratia fonticola]TQI95159.1 hypothetical protein FHU11_0526 [Serratia fonticola]TVZ69657.1 hypothetical protein FHU10_2185 [Serratia fonticola]